MKLMQHISLLTFIFILFSCSSNDDGGNEIDANRPSSCINATGITGVYWDYANSIPPPFTQIPILSNPGAQFIHSQHPYLGITIPQGYTAFESQDFNIAPLGVDVVRNDNAAVWRYVPLSSYPEGTSLDNILSYEINGMLNNFGSPPINQVLCSRTDQTTEFGFLQEINMRLLQFGDFTALVYVLTARLPGLPVSVSASVSVAPTNEFENVVMDVFFPLSYQLLVSDRDTLSDRDQDGVPDIFDTDPDNPNVQ